MLTFSNTLLNPLSISFFRSEIADTVLQVLDILHFFFYCLISVVISELDHPSQLYSVIQQQEKIWNQKYTEWNFNQSKKLKEVNSSEVKSKTVVPMKTVFL